MHTLGSGFGTYKCLCFVHPLTFSAYGAPEFNATLNTDIYAYNFCFLGGGGVGKTFLIKTISKWAEKILRKAGEDPTHPKVLLLAPTGKSASLIGKFFKDLCRFLVLDLQNMIFFLSMQKVKCVILLVKIDYLEFKT